MVAATLHVQFTQDPACHQTPHVARLRDITLHAT